jgi:hypothetical protein
VGLAPFCPGPGDHPAEHRATAHADRLRSHELTVGRRFLQPAPVTARSVIRDPTRNLAALNWTITWISRRQVAVTPAEPGATRVVTAVRRAGH